MNATNFNDTGFSPAIQIETVAVYVLFRRTFELSCAKSLNSSNAKLHDKLNGWIVPQLLHVSLHDYISLI